MKDLFMIMMCVSMFGCSTPTKTGHVNKVWEEVGYNNTDSLVKPGIPAYNGTIFTYKRDGKCLLTVRLENPAIASLATKPEKWGFFQFPSIYRSQDGRSLVATWNMGADAVTSYGKGGNGIAVSRDNGKSWEPAGVSAPLGGGLLLPTGDRIYISTPMALDTIKLKLPKPVGSAKESYGRNFVYYKHSELPANLQGVYLSRLVNGGSTRTSEHGVLDDPQAVRYTDSGMFPVVWWGDMKIAADGSIIAGTYPGFYLNEKGKVDPSGISFYRSTDEGRTWKIQGRIRYEPDLKSDPNGNKRLALGFTEPGFEILSDGTFLCVLRTTDGLGNSPMYISRSMDMGITWSRSEPFVRAGVLPRLLQLENGVIVMASGRPGVQLRFCADGKGEKWTDPFEMLPWETGKETVSCGYTELLATGPDRFLLIYSDFKYLNDVGTIRKAIKVREVIVTPP